MTSVTPPRTRPALACGAVVLLLAGAGGCDSGNHGGQDGGSASAGATQSSGVTTVVTLEKVGKQLDAANQAQLKTAVTKVIDPWFDGAFLGDFPRSHWSQAFSGFTKDAATDAQHRDLDLLTNAGIAQRIDSATATRRLVRLSVFAYKGEPQGATAHVVLDFTTKGDLQKTMEVRGDLYLTKDKGGWKIFGYDIDQAAPA